MNCRPRFEFEMSQLDTDNELRRVVARRYLAEISNDKIVLPHWDLSNNHVFICLLLEQQTERNCKVT
jgi:hypothetical protein